MASFKNIPCGCGCWVSAEGMPAHVRSPVHGAWAKKQGLYVETDKLRPLPRGIPWAQRRAA